MESRHSLIFNKGYNWSDIALIPGWADFELEPELETKVAGMNLKAPFILPSMPSLTNAQVISSSFLQGCSAIIPSSLSLEERCDQIRSLILKKMKWLV